MQRCLCAARPALHRRRSLLVVAGSELAHRALSKLSQPTNDGLDIPVPTPLQAQPPLALRTPSSSRHLLKEYSRLCKSQLSALVVLTTLSGVALSPAPTIPILLATASGTALCIASANALNQLQETPFDAQMTRTRTRPLVRRAIGPLHAALFASTTGAAGVGILWFLVNPTTALLGAGNIALYAGLYTWLKRRHIVNTWVGAVVGAIPPVMGWTACGGTLLGPPVSAATTAAAATTTVIPFIDVPLAPVALFVLLFSWQFPHFNSLSHLTRASYARAGFQMLSAVSPERNARVALRHALVLVPACAVLVPLSGLTTWGFAITSLVPNAVLAHAAWRFWRSRREKEARALFQHSLWYLPAVLGLMMLHKQGLEWPDWLGVRHAAYDEGVNKEEQKEQSGS